MAASPLGPHSYDPGISPSGVFWTTPVSPGSVKFDLRKETASLHVRDVLVFDAFTVPNALDEAHPAGRVNSIINSLRIEWSQTTRETEFENCDPNAFRGHYFENSATIEVIATTPPTPASTCPARPARNGFRFVSDPAETTVNHFSQIGREQNGVLV
jgi:hypothetical protein